jgi:hypothetical protein
LFFAKSRSVILVPAICLQRTFSIKRNGLPLNALINLHRHPLFLLVESIQGDVIVSSYII